MDRRGPLSALSTPEAGRGPDDDQIEPTPEPAATENAGEHGGADSKGRHPVTADETAPTGQSSTKRAVTVGVAVVAAVAIGAYFVASHDDPVVVDNGPVKIHRPDRVPGPDGDRWTLGKIGKLKLLHVLSWKTGTAEPFALAPPISLEGVHDITFDLVKGAAQPTTSLTIFRDAWNESILNQHARVKPKGLFKVEGGGLATLDPDYRVAQIRLDSGDIVCLRDGERPKPEKCTSWTYAPEKIKVVLCTDNEEKCRAVMTAH